MKKLDYKMYALFLLANTFLGFFNLTLHFFLEPGRVFPTARIFFIESL